MKLSSGHILYLLIILSFCIGMLMLLRLTRQEAAEDICTDVKISFTDSLGFVTDKEIRNYINSEYGCCVGKRLHDINLARLEELIESKTAIRNAEAWTNRDGILRISISQREPRLRFINNGNGFYVDDQGFIFPLHKSYTAPVTAIYGQVPADIPAGYKGRAGDESERNWIMQVINMCRYIDESDLWRGRIDRISAEKDGNLEFIVDGVRFILGQPEGYAERFSRMEKFYTHILPATGKGCYKSVNLKFNKQIICRKDI